jgi:peptidyl-prolyl cis-trans isomerase C
MVGQVNGQPIYANHVFEPMHEELARLGQTLPRGEFRRRAEALVVKRLNELVFDNLILGEAERDLSQQEQVGLQNKLKELREELLRVEGQSSEAVANQRLMESQGVTVDQKMNETRQQLLVRRYMSLKLLPGINVTRRDIERFYQENYREFNPPPGRTLRVIRAGNEDDAKKIAEELAAGKPFAEVASSKLNRHLTDKGGVMIDNSGNEKFFGLPALNDTANKLKVGEYAGPVEANGYEWWVYLDSVTRTPGKPLREVQLRIEQTLRKQRYQAETKRYQEKLFTEGTYNPIDKMAASLVEIAMARYALPE